MAFHLTILTDRRYVQPAQINAYTQNVLDEDRLLFEACERQGLVVKRTNWDDPHFDWSATQYIIFRTTWDYFERFDEFSSWLEKVEHQTQLINPRRLIYWNLDKHYLIELARAGVRIAPTHYIQKRDGRSLKEIVDGTAWSELILKPAVSGAARHTYKFKREDAQAYQHIFEELIAVENMMLQEYQRRITETGEVSMMVFGGKFSHAILKKAKEGDFRVQDDFGGTVHPYNASPEEISFTEKAISACPIRPIYARVDVFWDNEGELILGELELIEPELWFRMDHNSADMLANELSAYIQQPTAPSTAG